MFALATLLIINDEHKYICWLLRAYGSFARNFWRVRVTGLDATATAAAAESTPFGECVFELNYDLYMKYIQICISLALSPSLSLCVCTFWQAKSVSSYGMRIVLLLFSLSLLLLLAEGEARGNGACIS